jgi:hypothetical protein
MSRNINTSLQNKLEGRSVFVADLIEMHFDTPIYLTTTNINLSFDSITAPTAGSNTYLAQGQFLSYGNIVESSDLRIGTLELTFTAVDTTMVAVVLNNNYIDKRVVIYRAVLGDDYTFTSNDVFLVFDGRITGYLIKEADKTAEIILTCASQFADFERTNGRRTNPASQNLHFSGDRGMDFSPQIVKDIAWGRPV